MTEQQQRADISELRAGLSGTVEELAHRVDVPARARARKDETVRRLRERLDHATGWARENPWPVAAAALTLGGLLLGTLRNRSRS